MRRELLLLATLALLALLLPQITAAQQPPPKLGDLFRIASDGEVIYYDAYMQSLNIYDPDEESSFVAYCPSFDVADIKTFDIDLDGIDEVFVATKCFKMEYKGEMLYFRCLYLYKVSFSGGSYSLEQQSVTEKLGEDKITRSWAYARCNPKEDPGVFYFDVGRLTPGNYCTCSLAILLPLKGNNDTLYIKPFYLNPKTKEFWLGGYSLYTLYNYDPEAKTKGTQYIDVVAADFDGDTYCSIAVLRADRGYVDFYDIAGSAAYRGTLSLTDLNTGDLTAREILDIDKGRFNGGLRDYLILLVRYESTVLKTDFYGVAIYKVTPKGLTYEFTLHKVYILGTEKACRLAAGDLNADTVDDFLVDWSRLTLYLMNVTSVTNTTVTTEIVEYQNVTGFYKPTVLAEPTPVAIGELDGKGMIFAKYTGRVLTKTFRNIIAVLTPPPFDPDICSGSASYSITSEFSLGYTEGCSVSVGTAIGFSAGYELEALGMKWGVQGNLEVSMESSVEWSFGKTEAVSESFTWSTSLPDEPIVIYAKSEYLLYFYELHGEFPSWAKQAREKTGVESFDDLAERGGNYIVVMVPAMLPGKTPVTTEAVPLSKAVEIFGEEAFQDIPVCGSLDAYPVLRDGETVSSFERYPVVFESTAPATVGYGYEVSWDYSHSSSEDRTVSTTYSLTVTAGFSVEAEASGCKVGFSVSRSSGVGRTTSHTISVGHAKAFACSVAGPADSRYSNYRYSFCPYVVLVKQPQAKPEARKYMMIKYYLLDTTDHPLSAPVKYGVEVQPLTPLDKSVNPAESVKFKFKVWNRGLCVNNVTISMDTSQLSDWTVEANATSLQMNPRESKVIEVVVKPPIQAEGKRYYSIPVTISSDFSSDPACKADFTLKVYVNPVRDIELSCEEKEQWVHQGEMATYFVRAWNYGNVEANFTFDYNEPPADWDVKLNTTSYTNVPPGEYRVVKVEVTPKAAEPEEFFKLTLMGTSTFRVPTDGGETSVVTAADSIDLITYRKVDRGVAISVDKPIKSVSPSDSVSFTLRVVNLGEVEDTYDLNVRRLPEGWLASFDRRSVTVEPGCSEAITLTIWASEDAREGTQLVEVVASSRSAPIEDRVKIACFVSYLELSFEKSRVVPGAEFVQAVRGKLQGGEVLALLDASTQPFEVRIFNSQLSQIAECQLMFNYTKLNILMHDLDGDGEDELVVVGLTTGDEYYAEFYDVDSGAHEVAAIPSAQCFLGSPRDVGMVSIDGDNLLLLVRGYVARDGWLLFIPMYTEKYWLDIFNVTVSGDNLIIQLMKSVNIIDKEVLVFGIDYYMGLATTSYGDQQLAVLSFTWSLYKVTLPSGEVCALSQSFTSKGLQAGAPVLQDVDGDGQKELLMVGLVTRYSIIPLYPALSVHEISLADNQISNPSVQLPLSWRRTGPVDVKSYALDVSDIDGDGFNEVVVRDAGADRVLVAELSGTRAVYNLYLKDLKGVLSDASRSSCYLFSTTSILKARILERYKPSLLLEQHRVEALPGDRIVVPITVVNEGNRKDVIDLSLTGYPEKWLVTLSQYAVPLLPRLQAEVYLTVDIPEDARANQRYLIGVGGYSEGYPGVCSYDVLEVFVKDVEPPSRVPYINITDLGTGDRLLVTWSPASDNVGVAYYELYRNGTLLATLTTNSFLDTEVNVSTTYVYSIRAVDVAGNAGPFKASQPAKPTDVTPPYVYVEARPSICYLPAENEVSVKAHIREINLDRISMMLVKSSGEVTPLPFTETSQEGGVTICTASFEMASAGTYKVLVEANDTSGNKAVEEATVKAFSHPRRFVMTGAPREYSYGAFNFQPLDIYSHAACLVLLNGEASDSSIGLEARYTIPPEYFEELAAGDLDSIVCKVLFQPYFKESYINLTAFTLECRRIVDGGSVQLALYGLNISFSITLDNRLIVEVAKANHTALPIESAQLEHATPVLCYWLWMREYTGTGFESQLSLERILNFSITVGETPWYSSYDLCLLGEKRQLYLAVYHPSLDEVKFYGLDVSAIQVGKNKYALAVLRVMEDQLSDFEETLRRVLTDTKYWEVPVALDIVVKDSEPPGKPALLSPEENASRIYPPTLMWLPPAYSRADAYLTYEVQLYRPGEHNFTYTGLDLSYFRCYTPSELPPGVWFWRVRAIDSAGNVGEWSASRCFFLGEPGVGVPVLFKVIPIGESTKTVGVNQTGRFYFKVVNMGGVTDTYSIEVNSTVEASVNASLVTLAPGESAVVELTVKPSSIGVYVTGVSVRSTALTSMAKSLEFVTVATTTPLREPEWTITLRFTAGNSTTPITVGAAGDATEGYDAGYDEPAPPMQPSSPIYVYLYYPENPVYYRKLMRSIIGSSDLMSWNITVASYASTTVTVHVKWAKEDLSDLPENFTALLETPKGVYDMKTSERASFTLAAGQTAYVELVVGRNFTYTLSLKKGWSMVSVPVAVEVSLEGLPLYAYRWNPSTSSYEGPLKKLEPGYGYWVYAAQNTSITISGPLLREKVLSLSSPGWHMIGGLYSKSWMQVEPAGSLLSEVYTWDPATKSYVLVDELHPGHGYWIFARQPCTVKLVLIP